jgi:hypothetical protein
VHVAIPIYNSQYAFPDNAACGAAYETAVKAGADEIVVECEGQRPRRYTMNEVRALIRRRRDLAQLGWTGFIADGRSRKSGEPDLRRLPAGYKRRSSGLVIPA